MREAAGGSAGAAPSAGPGADVLAAPAAHPSAARATDGQEFVVRRSVTDADGTPRADGRTNNGLRVLRVTSSSTRVRPTS
ncbi:hypothetical protein [Nocardioides sp. InS609-2]|uniref:hypothetical protein n=1 Tax=Nocardioides sp. InS609-2 TaxID=2760705 RepID=UPI0020C07ED8|nr:hypothetical protein [Nocardioides sp. InS609-2]